MIIQQQGGCRSLKSHHSPQKPYPNFKIFPSETFLCDFNYLEQYKVFFLEKNTFMAPLLCNFNNLEHRSSHQPKKEVI